MRVPAGGKNVLRLFRKTCIISVVLKKDGTAGPKADDLRHGTSAEALRAQKMTVKKRTLQMEEKR